MEVESMQNPRTICNNLTNKELASETWCVHGPQPLLPLPSRPSSWVLAPRPLHTSALSTRPLHTHALSILVPLLLSRHNSGCNLLRGIINSL